MSDIRFVAASSKRLQSTGEMRARGGYGRRMSHGGEKQSSSTVLMVRPAAFGFNAEAAKTNLFSHAPADADFVSRAVSEFECVARRLSDAGVEVLVLEDSAEPAKPDAVFPNNWFSTHADGTLVLYPMSTEPRRLERRQAELVDLLEQRDFRVERTVDLSRLEEGGCFLEGTGSLVLDRPRRCAFAALGPRTHPDAVDEFDRALGYSTFLFDAADRAGRPIYHTNVLLSLGTRFALLCVEAVFPDQRRGLVERIEESGRTVIPLGIEQMSAFGCNLIELENGRGEPVVALSSAAKACLRPDQLRALETLGGELLDADIPTIERVGGGGVRCMIADVHLPRG